jgi:hypothetical protein
MLPETVVTWKWKPAPGYRSLFGAEQVNVLRRMVARHFPHPHRFICVTDDPAGLDLQIETVPIWDDYATIPSPHGGRNPSCYRRLRAFHPEIRSTFGQRFVSLDLDTVIVRDLTPLWDRPDDFVIWGDTNPQPGSHYNGSMFLLTAGARPQVWTEFDPTVSPQQSRAAGCYGSDQGWMSFILGGKETRWTRRDGVYSFRNDVQPIGKLPDDARIVMFHGAQDPWGEYAQRLPWVQKSWR